MPHGCSGGGCHVNFNMDLIFSKHLDSNSIFKNDILSLHLHLGQSHLQSVDYPNWSWSLVKHENVYGLFKNTGLCVAIHAVVVLCRFAIDTMQSICLDEFGGEKALDLSTQETTLIQHIFGGHLQSQVKRLASRRFQHLCLYLLQFPLYSHNWLNKIPILKVCKCLN